MKPRQLPAPLTFEDLWIRNRLCLRLSGGMFFSRNCICLSNEAADRRDADLMLEAGSLPYMVAKVKNGERIAVRGGKGISAGRYPRSWAGA